MTDYTKSTNFTSKDSLSTGNALKIIKGAEFDTEFNAIATAVATKADINSPTFIGTPAAPTASVGTNTTQLATTAHVFAIMQTIYPVGIIYTSTSSTNPAGLLGFGTWVAYGAGRVLIGNGSGFSAGATGGSADSIVPAHTHSITDPGHTHLLSIGSGTGANTVSATTAWSTNGTQTKADNGTNSILSSSTGITATNSTGSSATNANLPPYIVVYMWNRVS